MDQIQLLSRKFGIMAVKKGFATRDEIDSALNEQKQASAQGEPVVHIADILVKSGIMTPEQKADILSRQGGHKEKKHTENDRNDPGKADQDLDESHMGFDITVSEDKTKAYILPKGEGPCKATLEHIKALLERNGISYGVVADTQITEYLAHESLQQEEWLIAQGERAEAGQGGKIQYYFDTYSLKDHRHQSGMADGEEWIQFQQVKKGEVIAKKIPGTNGSPGIDIYGRPIPAPESKDIAFHLGKGVEISEDGQCIIARVDGIPELCDDGKVCVFPCLEITEDVFPEIGHIEFDGHIRINGTIGDGVQVSGRSLHAKEVLKAELNIDGDVLVQRGIIGTRIRNRGRLKANHIHKVDIETLDDVVIENELIDSHIKTNGRCLIERGKIRASVIAAKKGVNALEIGSATSSPCTLKIGTDNWFMKEIQKLNKQIADKEKEGKRLKSIKDHLERELDRVGEKIELRAQDEAPIMAQQVALKNKKEKLRDTNEPGLMAKTEEAIQQLELKLIQISETVERLFDEQGKIEEKIAGSQNDIGEHEKQVAALRDKINHLETMIAGEKDIPIIRVFGTIFAKTLVQGPHSEVTLEENFNHVRIREVKSHEPGHDVQWEMNISEIG